MASVLITVKGSVQGVFYRAFAKREAEKLGLLGYVKNLDNGSVEMLAQGPEKAISQFIKLCRKGPPGSSVTRVLAEKLGTEKEYKGFSIAY